MNIIVEKELDSIPYLLMPLVDENTHIYFNIQKEENGKYLVKERVFATLYEAKIWLETAKEEALVFFEKDNYDDIISLSYVRLILANKFKLVDVPETYKMTVEEYINQHTYYGR